MSLPYDNNINFISYYNTMIADSIHNIRETIVKCVLGLEPVTPPGLPPALPSPGEGFGVEISVKHKLKLLFQHVLVFTHF